MDYTEGAPSRNDSSQQRHAPVIGFSPNLSCLTLIMFCEYYFLLFSSSVLVCTSAYTPLTYQSKTPWTLCLVSSIRSSLILTTTPAILPPDSTVAKDFTFS